MENTNYYSIDILHEFICRIFLAVGVPKNDVGICADVLLESDIRGIESHGLSRLKTYIDRILNGQQKPVTEIQVIRETASTALIDGNHGMGAVIATTAMQKAIQKAKECGTGSVAVRNSTHFGIAGYYPLMAVKEGLIGFCVTNTRPSMAPTFGVQPLLGTNPIAFGAPTDEDIPFLFDAATTIIQRGKVEVAARKGSTLPEGWVIDQNGFSAIDPGAILTGLGNDTNSLLPLGGNCEEFGGHKGYGLATIVEILSASLQSGNFLTGLTGISFDGKKQPFGIGHFFQAISIESFTDTSDFRRTTGEIIRTLRNSKKGLGQKVIYTAGEKEYRASLKARKNGIAISSVLADELNTLARKLNITSPMI